MSWVWSVAWVAIDVQIPRMIEISIQERGQLSQPRDREAGVTSWGSAQEGKKLEDDTLLWVRPCGGRSPLPISFCPPNPLASDVETEA